MKSNKNPEQLPLLGKIIFNDVDVKLWCKQRNRIKRWIQKAIIEESFQLNFINFNFCSDKKLLSINREYLKHDYYTDIITFQLSDSKEISGDIYISLDRVKDNAKEHQETYHNELLRVLIHGTLHLCGYKDKSHKEAALMREKEDYYLSLF